MKLFAGFALLAATVTATSFDTFYLKTTAVAGQPELFVVAESGDLHESNLVLKQQPSNAALFAFKNGTIESPMAHGSRSLTLFSYPGSQVGRVVIGDRPATTGFEKDDGDDIFTPNENFGGWFSCGKTLFYQNLSNDNDKTSVGCYPVGLLVTKI